MNRSEILDNGNYYIYLRKSRKDMEAEAHGEGETLRRHENILLGLAKRLNLTVTKIFREIVSGETIAARPEMQKLLQEVEQGMCAGVLVVEIERLARGDTRDQGYVAEAFTYSSTKIITPVKIYDPTDPSDSEYFEFSLFMSRREYKTTNRRLESGRIASFNEGKYIGNIPPYGYQRKKLEHQKGFILVPDPDEAPIVQMIFRWFTGQDDERIGISKIVAKLNKNGVPTRKGGDWTPSTIRGILENNVYIGKLHWKHRKNEKTIENGIVKTSRPRSKNYLLVNGLHKPIIDPKLFKLAQEYLKISSPRVPSKKEIANPLAGLIVCSGCGRKMVRRPYSNHNQFDTLICPYTSCRTVSSRLYLVEEKLLEILKIWLADYETQVPKEDHQNMKTSEITLKKKLLSQRNKELEKINLQRNNLYDLLEQGVYSTEVFLSRSKELEARHASLTKETESIKKEIERLRLQEKSKDEFAPQCKYLINNYEYLDVESKNELLHELLEKVIYTKTEKNKRGEGDQANFELEIFPRVPQIDDLD